MTATPLDQALDRCERALLRIERSATDRASPVRESDLRAKVAAVVAELDEIIGAAHAPDRARG